MASFRGHLTFSTTLGVAYGGLMAWQFHADWALAILAAEVTAIGGILPDIDSDSGKPIREMFNLAAVVAPLLLLRRLQSSGITMEQILVVLSVVYLAVRYGLSEMFKRWTVHRGMFHSIPAMLIAGLMVFVLYHDSRVDVRLYLACGTMLGFLSHLVLDELCSVDFSGNQIRLNKFAGSALKLMSSSWRATLFTYTWLLALAWGASLEFEGPEKSWEQIQKWTTHALNSEPNRDRAPLSPR